MRTKRNPSWLLPAGFAGCTGLLICGLLLEKPVLISGTAILSVLVLLAGVLPMLTGWRALLPAGREAGSGVAARYDPENLAREKQLLLHVVCHDLNNILSVISGNTSLIKNHLMSGHEDLTKIRRWIDTIERAARLESEMIRHVLETDALERGMVDLPLTPVDLGIALEQVRFLFAGRLARKDIRWTIRPEQLRSGIFVRAEAVSLRNQVLANILSNSLKFSWPGSEVTLDIQVNRDTVVLQFRDQGIGIPPDRLAGLFQPHQAASRRGTLGEAGTGHGLNLAAKYVELFGGRLRLESPAKPGDRGGTLAELTLQRVWKSGKVLV